MVAVGVTRQPVRLLRRPTMDGGSGKALTPRSNSEFYPRRGWTSCLGGLSLRPRPLSVDVAGRGSAGCGRPTRAIPPSSQCPSARSRPPEVEILALPRREVQWDTNTGFRQQREPSLPIRRRICLQHPPVVWNHFYFSIFILFISWSHTQ